MLRSYQLITRDALHKWDRCKPSCSLWHVYQRWCLGLELQWQRECTTNDIDIGNANDTNTADCSR